MDKSEQIRFNNWNVLKKKLQGSSKVEYFRERQIWWCYVGQNIGYEVYGKGQFYIRPVLIFKKLSNDSFVGIPLTSRVKNGSWFVKFVHKGKNVNAMLHQIRIFDKRRLQRRFGEVDNADYESIRNKFISLYSENNHPALRRESMGKSQK